MKTQISPMLAVSDAPAAIDFYQRAFGAEVSWQLGEPAAIAGMVIEGAEFFLAEESPENGTLSPDTAGHTTVRIELFVDDPYAVQTKAIAAGATETNPVQEHSYPTSGPRPINRMLQGGIQDPFGHRWIPGKFLD